MEQLEQGSWLITGGGGFMARALYARARNEGWTGVRFTAIGRDDTRLQQVRDRFPEVDIRRVDITRPDELAAVAYGHTGIIHLAAAKHVDVSERAVFSTITQNITGSENVLRVAAATQSVMICVGISTDKAVDPANVYGMTKALMERMFEEVDGTHTRLRCRIARYGNVIASSGSAIPVMIQKALAGERLKITDPTMTRFFFPADQGVDLIIRQADIDLAESGRGGMIAVPRMGSVTLTQMAEAVQEIAANHVGYDVIGARPGEKQHERLIGANEWPRFYRRDGDILFLRGVLDRSLMPAGATPPNQRGLEHFSERSDDAKPIDPGLFVAWIREALAI